MICVDEEVSESAEIAQLVSACVPNKRLVFVVTMLEFDGPHDMRLEGGGWYWLCRIAAGCLPDQWPSPGRRPTRVLKHCHSTSSAIRFYQGY